MGIGAQHPRFKASPLGGIKMDKLTAGVYAGVSTPGTMHPQFTVGDLGKRSLQLRLDSSNMKLWLNLPTAVGSAIVFNTAGNPTARGVRDSRNRISSGV